MGCLKDEDVARLERVRILLEYGGIGEPMPVTEPDDEIETDSFRDWTGED